MGDPTEGNTSPDEGDMRGRNGWGAHVSRRARQRVVCLLAGARVAPSRVKA